MHPICSSLAIPELKLIEPARHHDLRGIFCETWNSQTFAQLGIPDSFVQDNFSASQYEKTVRGLHMQTEPFSQGKLIRVLRGSIWDVVVDMRLDSPTFRQHVAVVLTAANWRQLWIPPGFLHGYCTLEAATEIVYKVTKPYRPDAEIGVFWRDTTLNLPWPIGADEALISERDAKLAAFAEVEITLRNMKPLDDLT
jgi:dTDP-4-dehydrorhamnose 3,5-epimerase